MKFVINLDVKADDEPLARWHARQISINSHNKNWRQLCGCIALWFIFLELSIIYTVNYSGEYSFSFFSKRRSQTNM